MEDFVKVSILLCIYGIFKEFRPAEPFLIPLLSSPPLNFTGEQITQDIFPVSVYSTLVLLVLVFLVTDLLRYKVVIVAQAISAIATYLLIFYGRGLFEMQIMQVIYGFYLASEVAYFTYIYAKVDDTTHFQKVTSYTRSAYLVGKCLSGIFSQASVYFELTSYQGLLWITVGSEVVALIWAIFLPSVDRSIYFHRKSSEGNEINNVTTISCTSCSCGGVVKFLWNDLTSAFTNLYVVKWALWWALGNCGYYMVTYNIQVLWETIWAESNATGVQWNGIVETSYTLLGALAAMLIAKFELNWKTLGEPFLAVCSLVLASLLAWMTFTNYVVVAYLTYIAFSTIFQIMITIANSEVAKHINKDSYGLVFGVTTFAVYLLFSIFTYIALQVFRLEVRVQFGVYAIYFAVLGLFFLTTVITRCICFKTHSSLIINVR